MRKYNNPYNEKGSYKCPKCGEEFRIASSLWIHKHNECEADKPVVSFKS